MIVSPGTSRKFWRATPKQLLLFERPNVSLARNGQKEPLHSELNLGNRHSALSSLTPLLSRLSWSRESLADELHHSGVCNPGLDCHRSPRYLTISMVTTTTILYTIVPSRTTPGRSF